jgi:hypothetical protein
VVTVFRLNKDIPDDFVIVYDDGLTEHHDFLTGHQLTG